MSFKILLICSLATMLAVPCFAQKNGAAKPGASSGSTFEITIEHDGKKTEIRSTQFKSADGNAVNADKGRVNLFFGASNDADEKNFTFNGWVKAGATGIFALGESADAGFSFMTSLVSNVPMFMPEKGGTIEITANPTQGGFVTGTFQGACKNVTDQGTIETYHVSGSFKLARR